MKACNRIRRPRGFTLVEILVVLVIIAILMISAVPFIGRAQADARDDRREADIAIIAAALESYYQDNGEYPTGQGSSTINAAWSTTADASWSNLQSKLVPKYIAKLPADPSEETGKPAMSKGLAYEYFSNTGSLASCGKGILQTYILLYNFEGRPRKENHVGSCPSSALGPYPDASTLRVARDNT